MTMPITPGGAFQLTGASLDGLALALQTVIAQNGQIAADLAAMRAEVGTLATRLAVIEAAGPGADGWHADMEARLRVVERFKYTLAGLVPTGGVIAGWVGQYLAAHVH